jgi:cobalt-zinc-cadmium efflux system membrane fusion protein
MKIINIKNQNKMKYVHSIKSVFVLAILIPILLLISSCTNSDKKVVSTKAEEPQKQDVTGQVSITKQQFDALNIEFGSIEHKNLRNNFKATGFLKAPPQSKANITSALGGTVQTILVQEGNRVSKGQTVLTLTNPEFIKMQEVFLDAKSQLVFAEAEYNRQKELSSKNVVSQKTFQQVEANYNSLRAKYNSLKQQLSLLGIKTSELTQENISSVINVVSPINGSVSEIDVNIGSNAEASKTLMDIVDNSHLHIDLFVFEQELPKVKIGQNVDFSLTNLPGKNFEAKIFSIGSAFENQTRTIPVHAEITGDKSGLIDGMSVTGLINIENDPVSSVLSTAIISSDGNDYIFIQTDGDGKQKVKEGNGVKFIFEKIQVKKGVTDGSYTEITTLQQIPDNAKVVTNSAFYLMAMFTNAGEVE